MFQIFQQSCNSNYYSSFFSLSLVDCIWGAWVPGTCSKTCGNGILIDTRQKLQEQNFGGAPCKGEPTRQTDCLIEDCPSKYIFHNSQKTIVLRNYTGEIRLYKKIILLFNIQQLCSISMRRVVKKTECLSSVWVSAEKKLTNVLR